MFQIQLGGLGRVTIPKQFCHSYHHLSLETVFPAFKLTQNCYMNYNHKLSTPLSLLQTYCALKTILSQSKSSQSKKISNKREFKNLNFQNLQWIGINVKAQSRIIFKKLNSPPCYEWEKMRSSDRATLKSRKMFLSILKNLEVQPKNNTQKIQILNPWMNWENFCPNWSFSVENLLKMRQFAFET